VTVKKSTGVGRGVGLGADEELDDEELEDDVATVGIG
jgi:hypothetical protein